jgi:hypothetical protein
MSERDSWLSIAPGVDRLVLAGKLAEDALTELVVSAVEANSKSQSPLGLFKQWVAPGATDIFVLVVQGGERVYVFTRGDVEMVPASARRKLERMIQTADANPPGSCN